MTNANSEKDVPPQNERPAQKEEEQLKPPKMVTVPDTELDRLRKESADYKDKYLRQLAEMENMRKRLQKERQEISQYAAEGVVVDFLSPIDHMENALKFTQQMSEEVKHWGIGFQMILNQFKDALANNGVTPFPSEGTPFDPNLHEAVEMVLSDKYPPGIVVEESVRGYKMGNKVVRPARVKVSKAPHPEPASSNESEEKGKNDKI
jgi:molecular chaperone GrpE